MRWTASLALALCWMAAEVAAQERLAMFTVVGTQPRYVEVDVSEGGFGRVLTVTPLTHVPSYSSPTAIAVVGGRFLVWLDTSAMHPGSDLFVFDRRSRTVTVAPTSMLPPQTSPIGALRLIRSVDPRFPRVFVHQVTFEPGGGRRQHVWALDLLGGPPTRLVSTTSDGGVILDASYAHTSRELFVNVLFEPGGDRMDVVDPATGVVRRSWPAPSPLFWFTAAPAGDRVWANLITLSATGFATFDGATGAVTSLVPGVYLWNQQYDETRDLLLTTYDNDRLLVVLDPVSLAPLATLNIGDGPGGYLGRGFIPGRGATGGYLVGLGTDPVTGRCNRATVERLGTDGGRRAVADIFPHLLPTGAGCSAGALLLQPPLPPQRLSAAVSGHAVSFTLELPDDATGLALEFGFGPGQTVGTLPLGLTSTVAVPGVPPGTYYVRVRGTNDLGAGAPSNEVRVSVQ